MAMRINHLFVSSTDVERSARFHCDFDLLIVPTGTTKLPLANHIAFEVDSADEFEDLFQKAKAMGLSPRSDVPLESEAGVSTFSMYGRNYRHFYVLDPSWVNVEVMWRKPE
jgi:catechol 2,3-dioxygenase-like lactoylglutathione lyase family enzyme